MRTVGVRVEGAHSSEHPVENTNGKPSPTTPPPPPPRHEDGMKWTGMQGVLLDRVSVLLKGSSLDSDGMS
jgi:hypothetical protein